jgi:phosphatidylglycerol---prolipoprotein diacylglyceryl transferase
MALTFPSLDPVALAIGPFEIRWYALAYLVGFLGGGWLARRLIAKPALWGTPPPSAQILDDLVFSVAMGVILGGRLGYILFYNLPFYAENPMEIFAVWRGGMSFHGGLIGAILGVLWTSKRSGTPALALLDLVAVVVPIGLFFGRIANFINGELWGRASDVAWAVIFPHANGVPRHPSQLYEAATEGLFLFLIMVWAVHRFGFARDGRRFGLFSGLFAVGYGTARIGCEFFREPDPQLGFLAAHLTMGMVLSIPLIVGGILLTRRAYSAQAAPITL